MSIGSNARWIGISQLSRISLQLGSLAILARLLSPADYGLMSMAVVVTTFAALFRDLGTAAAVIQQKELSDEVASTIFWLNVILGVALSAVIVLSAPGLEVWLRLPGLARVLVALAPSFFFVGASSTHQAVMERRQDFRALACIEIVAGVVAVLLCIVAALAGLGVYSLVTQAVAQSVVSSLLLWGLARWRPRFVFERSQLRSLGRFSGNLAGFNFINYCARNADNVVIGRVLGSEALGAYALAYKLMLFPLQNMTMIAARALLPVLSRQQEDGDAAARVYLSSVRAIAFLTAPIMATMFVLRQPLVRLAFGPQWDVAAELLVWLAPTGFIQSIVSTSGTVFTAKGRTNVLFALGVFGAILSVGSFLIGVQAGTLSLVKWYFLANLLGAPVTLFVVMKVQGRPLRALLGVLLSPCVVGIATGLAVYLASRFIRLDPSYWREGLAIHGLLGIATFGMLLATAFKSDGNLILQFLRARK
jgi:PST family polysaccharide transporter